MKLLRCGFKRCKIQQKARQKSPNQRKVSTSEKSLQTREKSPNQREVSTSKKSLHIREKSPSQRKVSKREKSLHIREKSPHQRKVSTSDNSLHIREKSPHIDVKNQLIVLSKKIHIIIRCILKLLSQRCFLSVLLSII